MGFVVQGRTHCAPLFCVWRASCLPSPSVFPSPARRARGNAHQGAPPCTPTSLSHSVGEGLGVRANSCPQRGYNSPDEPLMASLGLSLVRTNAGTIHPMNPTNAVGVRSKLRRNYKRGGNRCYTP